MDDNAKKLTERLGEGKAALIVVDVQNDFCHADGAFGNRVSDFSFIERAMPGLCGLIDGCRASGVPVVFVRTFHSNWTDSAVWCGRMSEIAKRTPACRPDAWGSAFYRVAPGPSDYVVTKHRYSAFVGTDLDLVLKSSGVRTVMVAGFMTNVCVETTARDAYMHDYHVVLVEDCCGAPLPGEHESAVHNIACYFGLVADANTVLGIIKKGCERIGRRT